MRRLTIICTAAMLFVAMNAEAADMLDIYRWKARPVVVVGPSLADPRVAQQVAALNAEPHALSDYDIVVVEVADADQRRRLNVTDFAVILVGKDGGEKARWTKPVAPNTIYAEIDTMPMRQSERRRRS